MTRHLSHMVFTLALTFTIPFQDATMKRARLRLPERACSGKARSCMVAEPRVRIPAFKRPG